MRVSSLTCDVLLCTQFSQTLRQDAVSQAASHSLTTERVLAVWNCPCRHGSSLLYCCFVHGHGHGPWRGP